MRGSGDERFEGRAGVIRGSLTREAKNGRLVWPVQLDALEPPPVVPTETTEPTLEPTTTHPVNTTSEQLPTPTTATPAAQTPNRCYMPEQFMETERGAPEETGEQPRPVRPSNIQRAISLINSLKSGSTAPIYPVDGRLMPDMPADMSTPTNDPCVTQIAKMRSLVVGGKTVVIQTNLRGKTGSIGDERIPAYAKLETMVTTLKAGLAHIAILSETKLTEADALDLRKRLATWTTQTPVVHMRWSKPVSGHGRRGTMVLYRADCPYKSVKVLAADTHSRCVVLKFTGKKGHSLTVASAYFENRSEPGAAEQEKELYRWVGEHIPTFGPHAQKELFLLGGDLNVVMLPNIHRWPPKTDAEEDNRTVCSFAHEHGLIDAISYTHPNTHIYTHQTIRNATTTDPEKRIIDRAKLSSLLLNPAALARLTDAGWTETNPLFAGADHGLQWLALDLDAPSTSVPVRQQGEGTINFSRVTARTSAGRTGVPLVIDVPSTKSARRKNPLEKQIAQALSDKGYTSEHMVHHKAAHVVRDKDVEELHRTEGTPHATRPPFRLIDSVRWRPVNCEYWIHCATASVAAHLESLGQGLPPLKGTIPTTLEPLATPGTALKPKEWLLRADAATNGRQVRSWLLRSLKIPESALVSVKRQQEGHYSITFSDEKTYRFWQHYGTPLLVNTRPRGEEPDPQPVSLQYATGWEAVQRRQKGYLENPDSVPDDEVRATLSGRNDKVRVELLVDGNGNVRPTLNVWRHPDDDNMALTWLLNTTAEQCFGRRRPTVAKTHMRMSSHYFRYLTSMDRVMKAIHDEGWATRHAYKQTLRLIPFPNVQFRDTDTYTSWLRRIENELRYTGEAFRLRKRIEIQEDKVENMDRMDYLYAHALKRFLNDSLQNGQTNSAGLVCPMDEEGEPLESPDERKACLRDVFMRATESRVQDTTTTPSRRFWQQLLEEGNTGSFTDEQAEAIDSDLTEDDLARVLREIKPDKSTWTERCQERSVETGTPPAPRTRTHLL